jgi:hypothetical protein
MRILNLSWLSCGQKPILRGTERHANRLPGMLLDWVLKRSLLTTLFRPDTENKDIRNQPVPLFVFPRP